eukprot:9254270-Pyramimonas_sp.AAC.1
MSVNIHSFLSSSPKIKLRSPRPDSSGGVLGERVHELLLPREVPRGDYEAPLIWKDPSPGAHWINVKVMEGGDRGREEGNNLAPPRLASEPFNCRGPPPVDSGVQHRVLVDHVEPGV